MLLQTHEYIQSCFEISPKVTLRCGLSSHDWNRGLSRPSFGNSKARFCPRSCSKRQPPHGEQREHAGRKRHGRQLPVPLDGWGGRYGRRRVQWQKNRSSASITILQKYMPFIFLGGRLFVLWIQRFSGEASRFYQQFGILRHDFQQFDTLWAVAQPCKLHTMGIGEQKKRCKDVFAINMAAVFGIHETTRN